MAASKRSRQATGAPDPAVFDQIIRDGLAPVETVVDAYEHILGEWVDELRRTGAKAADHADVTTNVRPVTEPKGPPSVGALLIARRRARQLMEHPIEANFNEPQEEQ